MSGPHVRVGRSWAGWVALVLVLAVGCTSDPPAPRIATPPTSAAVALPGCPAPGAAAAGEVPLPDLELPCLGGSGGAAELPLRRLTGTPTVVNLWASWCPPCKDELPAFAALERDAGGKLRVLGVSSRESAARSAAYAEDARLPFPSLEDSDGTLLRELRRATLPVTVLVTADGSVARVYQGPPLTDTTLRALVRDELGVDV